MLIAYNALRRRSARHITEDRYVSVAACRPHSCMEKGFLWVATKTGAGLGAYHVEGALQLGSNSLSADHIPPQARAALIDWLGDQDLQTTAAEFIGRDGKRQALEVARYSGPPTYHPTSTGPAFDCKLAANSASCLQAQYTAQYDKLNHWIPTRPKQ